MIKIIFFDCDGTLVCFDNPHIRPAVVDSLKKIHEKGIKLIIATGRAPWSVSVFDEAPFDGLMAFNGSYCFDEKGIILSNPLDHDDLNIIIDNATKMGHCIEACNEKRHSTNGYEADLLEYIGIAHVEPRINDHFDELIQGDVYQLNIAARRLEYPSLLEGTSHTRIVDWWPKACDVIPKEGGKGRAVQAILDHYGFSKDEALAFGDGANDLDMFHACATSIAMGNADAEVQAQASWVSDTVENDGIVSGLKKYGLL